MARFFLLVGLSNGDSEGKGNGSLPAGSEFAAVKPFDSERCFGLDQGGDLGFSKFDSIPSFKRFILAKSFCFASPSTVSKICEYSPIVSRANRLW